MPRQDDRGFSRKRIPQLAASLHAIRRETTAGGDVQQSLADALQRDVPPDDAADMLAQAIACGQTIAGSFAGDWEKCRSWLAAQSSPWERFALELIGEALERRPGEPSSASFAELTHLYEHLLRYDQPQRRKRAGIFFTPQPIVRYMLRQIDAQLQAEFGLPLGLADEATWDGACRRALAATLPPGAGEGDPFVRLFDPAVGTGTFLLEAIDFIHDRLVETWRGKGLGDEEIADRWNDYVPRHLLPRLWGMEIMPAPCFLARLHVALKLAQTGYRFGEPARIEIHLGNTLAGPLLASRGREPPGNPCSTGGLTPPARREVAYDLPFTVVLGNPPFSYLSENRSDWITSLIRGDNGHAGYLQLNGERLGEKKTWLHDDYVKFLRYAQWRIETTGCGILAFVTNHGYLSNATFRMMRQQLLRTFRRVSVVDLHGNRKAREVAPDGEPDQNAFSLDQGTAIGFFRRPPNQLPPQVEHAELWGTREAKFQKLDSGQVCNVLCEPAAPDFLFGPAAAEIPPEYSAASSLTELLPVNATAPVTARDHFVVAFTHSELCERLDAFRDLSIADDEIRRRYFTRTRSPRYAPGDTRSWKLAAARRKLALLDDWESYIQSCQYRPLDWRWVFWHPAMIDWPRHEVTSRFVSPKSKVQSPKSGVADDCGLWTLDAGLALIARRQLPPSEPRTYFWATSALTLDGIIRNDNRGSESLFVIDSGAERMAHYAYALFHSPTYRQRYAGALRTDFPRVLLARDESLTTALADFGRQLIALHTQRPPPLAVGRDQFDPRLPAHLITVAPRFPQYEGGRVWIGDDHSIAAADEDVWQFRVGAHQVARKWLADRRGRPLTDGDIAWYAVILDTIGQTRALMDAIDDAIEQAGGFPAAFQ